MLSAAQNLKHHEGSSHVAIQIARDMKESIELGCGYPLFETFDDGCHQLMHRLALLVKISHFQSTPMEAYLVICLIVLDITIDAFHFEGHQSDQVRVHCHPLLTRPLT